MHEGTTDFLKLFTIVGAVAWFLYWLHTSFGKYYALGAVILIVVLTYGTLFFVLGSKHSAKVQQDTLNSIARFNAHDAVTDRYRMQSLRVVAQGETAKLKADSQLKVLEAKKELKLLPRQTNDEDQTFWSTNETVDLDEWS